MALGADERGVSNVVGATLIFGFLVIFLALYQATVVPNQNEQVEFDHSQAVQRDVVEVRNAILEASSAGRDTFAAVTLGTTYPARTIAINPPPVTGSLRTTPNRSFAVRNGSGSLVTGSVCPGDPETRFLVYEPNYHAYASGPDVVYENSVVYENFSSRFVVASDQTLVEDQEISLVPLQRSYSRSGIGTVTVEPREGNAETTTLENPVIELPTRLDNDTWNELLADELGPDENASVSPTDGNLTVELSGLYTLECRPVGVNDAPTGGAASAVAPPGPGMVVPATGGDGEPTRDTLVPTAEPARTAGGPLPPATDAAMP